MKILPEPHRTVLSHFAIPPVRNCCLLFCSLYPIFESGGVDMKKVILYIICLNLVISLSALEIYKTNIYPGAVNHWNSTYSYGLFSLNTMESRSGGLSIKRTLSFNNSATHYQYSYNSEGQLTGYSQSLSYGEEEPVSEGEYEYLYKEGRLSTVKLNGENIYFPTPYFISIRQSGDELSFEVERDENGEISAYVQNDENGTKYFFVDGRLRFIESQGTGDKKVAVQYDYDDEFNLARYRSEFSEGRGQSKKITKYDFIYKEGLIDSYLEEKSGQGQAFSRIRCFFEHITEDDGSPITSFALDDDGNILLTAMYQYDSPNKYSIDILDERNLLQERIEVEKR